MNDRKPYGQTMRGIAKKDDKILVVKRHPKSRHNPEQWEPEVTQIEEEKNGRHRRTSIDHSEPCINALQISEGDLVNQSRWILSTFCAYCDNVDKVLRIVAGSE